MKILAFNSSPRKSNGATDIILDKFLEGAKDAGGEIERIYLADKKINKCRGCFGCWTRTPGKCVFQNDDMPQILEKMEKADLIVFATPLYHFNMSADMKIMMEKTLPLLKPFLIKDKDLTKHPRRNGKNTNWVIISVCGFPEIEHFQALDLCFEQNARAHGSKIVGKIYRPASEALRAGAAPLFKEYLKNCYLAGKEVVEKGRVSSETQEKLYKDFLMPKFLFRFMANMFWKREMRKSK